MARDLCDSTDLYIYIYDITLDISGTYGYATGAGQTRVVRPFRVAWRVTEDEHDGCNLQGIGMDYLLPPDDGEVASPSQDRDEGVARLADLVMAHGALRFGRFPMRAGKVSPYQLDLGALCFGRDGFDLGRVIAKTLEHYFDEGVEVIYAATPRAVALAALSTLYYGHIANLNVEWAFADEGAILTEGRKVLVLDDVLTNGDPVRAAIAAVQAKGATVLGATVLVDRRERTKSNRIAANEIERETGVKVVSCATIAELVKKMPTSYLPDDKRELIVKHVTIEGGPVPPRFTP